MYRLAWTRAIALSTLTFFLALLLGCGGGGGGGGGGTVTVLASLKADLLGSNETVVVDPDACAVVLVRVFSNGNIAFAATAEQDYVADITGCHIHRGAPGVDGAIEVDLLSGGATFVALTRSASGTVSASATLAAEIAASPGDFYVNIHTSGAPAGLVRAQLAAFTGLELHSTIEGTNEVIVADPAAHGAASFAVRPDGTVDYVIAMVSPPAADVTAAHVHIGAPGIVGPIVVDLDTASGTLDAGAGTLSGTIAPALEILSRICKAPAEYYVSTHTPAAPGGVARGQITSGTLEFWACLSGDLETFVVDAGARGGATVQLTSFTTGRAMLATPVAQGIANVTAAHIHSGAAGIDGPVEIDLRAGPDYTVSGLSGSAEGEITLDQALFTRILADHTSFYVNFHSAAAPAGLVRAQLSNAPVSFFAALSGAEPTVVVDAGASGAAFMVFTGVFQCSFSISMVSPAATDAVGADLHDGFAGGDGPALIDLFLAPDLSIDPSVISGSMSITGRTLARLMADAGQTYADVHTAAAPDGVVRGQWQKLTGDTPPAGLSYTSPVTYPTNAAITANVPSSVGGAVSSYSVSPALPAGLQLNTSTGSITGTPTVPQTSTLHTVTATNPAGTAPFSIDITVTESAPTSLAYTTPVVYTQNTAITPNTPSNGGGDITSYTVLPALPTGLSLHPTTGVISGTPTVTQAATDHVVTGSNGGGSTQATVNVTVNSSLQPPSALSYTTPVTYTTGTAATNTPTISGGAVATWAISPTALASGLTFNTTTGVIGGTPVATKSLTVYTVTATNAAGSTNANVTITVNLGAPTTLTYTPNFNLGYVNQAIQPMNPSSLGGAVASYGINPALPTGLTFNTTTGVISGTPQGTSAETTYTITATNAAGNTATTVKIVVPF